MNASLTSEVNEVTVVNGKPTVSIIIPFEPKMTSKAEIDGLLKSTMEYVSRELKEAYPSEITALILEKLKSIITHLNFGTHKKSIAIYLSPVFEKVIYMDIPVRVKISIDNSFEIRELVHNKKERQQYLLLVMSEKESRVYLGDGKKIVKIVSDGVGSLQALTDKEAGRENNGPSTLHQDKKILDRFLRHVDNAMSILVNAYHLPVFVVAPAIVCRQFKGLTRNADAVIEYICGNDDNADTTLLASLLLPYLAEWKDRRQKDLLNMLEKPAVKRHSAIGLRNVWSEAMHSQRRILLIETGYSPQKGNSQTVIYMPATPYNKFSPIKDVVNDIIGNVLERGGDVEFVDKDVLKDYQHIALI